jgi:hypothetical protein
MNIELHIERLILDGLTAGPERRAAIQAAVEAELTSLLAAHGLSRELLAGGAVRSLGAGEIVATNQTGAAPLGNQIARAVHGSLSGQPQGGSGRAD